MAFSVSPAVTWEEVDATASVVASSTSPAAIVGVFRWGPVNERILVTKEDDIVGIFHKPAIYKTQSGANWTNVETFFSASGFTDYAGALYITRVVSDADPMNLTAKGSNFSAKYAGLLGNSIGVSYTDATGFERDIFAASSIRNSDDIVYNTNTFVIQTNVNYSGYIVAGDILRVGTPTIGYQNLIVDSVTHTSSTDPENSELVTYTTTLVFKNRYTLTELDYAELEYTRRWGYSAVAQTEPLPNSAHVVVYDVDGAISGSAGVVLEVFENLSLDPNALKDDGTNNFIREVINTRSKWINMLAESELDESIGGFAYEVLVGGSDGADEVGISFGALARGWDLYKEANEVDVSYLIQGKANGSSNLSNYIIQNVAEYRKDCVAFISPRFEDCNPAMTAQEKLNAIKAYRNTVQSSSYWMMDTGYKKRYDKYNDRYCWVPMNADVAGLCARILPWESPAGYKRGGIKNVVQLAFNPNKAQRDELFVKDINPIIHQVGVGTILFADKTGLGYGSAFNRINVRRLFITVEKNIATASAQFLFDFNDEFTQTQFRNMVEPYLRNIKGQRGIIDFTVVSDSRVNTPDIIDANVFRGNIYIKPARTISEIQLKFVATRTGTEFEEIIGQTI